jgi:hypothetical protein
MKTLIKLIVLTILFTGIAIAQPSKMWFMDMVNGSVLYTGERPCNNPAGTGPIPFFNLIENNSQEGDIINISSQVYSGCLNITKNDIINGYCLSPMPNVDISFYLSSCNMVFTMNGTTTFEIEKINDSDYSCFGQLLKIKWFNFEGSNSTGIDLRSGKILLSTADFSIIPPFLFQPTIIPGSNSGTPKNWYVDCINGSDINDGLSSSIISGFHGPKKTINSILCPQEVQSGDIINIAPGTYSESPYIAVNLTFQGTGPGTVTINLANGDMTLATGVKLELASTNGCKFNLTGSSLTGINFNGGCIYLSNATLNVIHPFLFHNEPVANSYICGKKFNDLNGNGICDPGEPSIPNWRINLAGTSSGTQKTDSDGNYCFDHLLPGAYTVTEDELPGWKQTFPQPPGSHSICLSANTAINNVNFGNKQICSCEKIDQEDGILPKVFSLSQNFPNPFNPSTKIKFSIPSLQFVTLKIYDVLGRDIISLVNEEKAPGNYIINFNGNNLPSGIYLFQIRAGNFIQMKKMTLIK